MTSTLRWFKSSYSDSSGGECVEVAFDAWHKSSYSDSGGGNCVELATCPHTVHIRDSKLQSSPTLKVAPASWSAFAAWAS
ncbi:DUF397 domain-containing protein [Streptomyces beijiangensis]|uniref:DUF397 domain-containing protein n=1 Tax=Streptomyces beijiangensis TaxID=163361 RepID=A0A939FFL3_9ACTN|nr:DUF397 domain-containing protein [Streptomyces beijiangensis]MBO0517209.1 DUF397 domain-containing protein [Streptomyces beijiangensis]